MHALARHSEQVTDDSVHSFTLPAGGRQWLPVEAHVVERYLVTFRAPAEALAPLVPAPLSLDRLDGRGFVSVCAIELTGMGVSGTPRWLRFDNREFLYRVGVRFRGAPSFLTLRSDVSAWPLAWLGRRFSHYRPNLARFSLTGAPHFRLACETPDGAGDALLELGPPGRAPRSLFADAATAARFLLGMRASVDVRGGRVQLQPIDHDPWRPQFVPVRRMRFTFLERLERITGARLVHDNTLGMKDLDQTWRATRWA
jgi:hypothetical protein